MNLILLSKGHHVIHNLDFFATHYITKIDPYCCVSLFILTYSCINILICYFEMHFRTAVYLATENRLTVEWWSTTGTGVACDYSSVSCVTWEGRRLRTTGVKAQKAQILLQIGLVDNSMYHLCHPDKLISLRFAKWGSWNLTGC